MFNPSYCIDQLSANATVFRSLLENISEAQYRHRPAPEKWSLLEIVCHLYDEEREDFRARLAHVLQHPQQTLPPIDPQGWVKARNYADQDYARCLQDFLEERRQSLNWLRGLQNPVWENAYQHPKFGPLSARLFLTNWVAHDYLHIRQIVFTLHDFLQKTTGESLKYAGDW